MTTKPDMSALWGSGSALLTDPGATKTATGWVVEKPPVEYMNWIQNRVDEYLSHINERGIPQWDVLTTYVDRAIVFGSDEKLYQSSAGSNIGHDPVSTSGYWKIFGGGTVFPTLENAELGAAANFIMQRGNVAPGFDEDGDWVRLPSEAVGSAALGYYDKTDAVQWSKAVTDINASCDAWVGFTYDNTDDLIYGIAVDEGTTPFTYYTFSVNKAGTIVNIGNDQPTVDFVSGLWWLGEDTSATDNATMIQRAAMGSGNLFIRQVQQNLGMLESEISISTGAFISDPAAVFGSVDYSIYLMHKTPTGEYISGGAGSAGYAKDSFYVAKDSLGLVFIPVGVIPAPSRSRGFHPVEWGKYMVLFSTVETWVTGTHIFDKDEFNVWAVELSAIGGAI